MKIQRPILVSPSSWRKQLERQQQRQVFGGGGKSRIPSCLQLHNLCWGTSLKSWQEGWAKPMVVWRRSRMRKTSRWIEIDQDWDAIVKEVSFSKHWGFKKEGKDGISRTLVRSLNTQNKHGIYVGNRKLLGKKGWNWIQTQDYIKRLERGCIEIPAFANACRMKGW